MHRTLRGLPSLAALIGMTAAPTLVGCGDSASGTSDGPRGGSTATGGAGGISAAGAGGNGGAGGDGGSIAVGGSGAGTHQIDPAVDNDIMTADGAGVFIPGDSLVTESGVPLTPPVAVTVESPLAANGSVEDMPGSFAGITTSGEDVTLVSFGVITVTLADAASEKVNLAPGKTATITVPPLVEGPSTIPLWHLADGESVWNEEGSAALVAGAYSGEVSHFSSWNLDTECVGACANVTVSNCGVPDPNVEVVARAVTTTCPDWADGALSGAVGMSDGQGVAQLASLIGLTTYELTAVVGGEPRTHTIEIPGFGTQCLDLTWDVCVEPPCADMSMVPPNPPCINDSDCPNCTPNDVCYCAFPQENVCRYGCDEPTCLAGDLCGEDKDCCADQGCIGGICTVL